MMPDDAQLLRQYTDEGSESAFGELVSRHLNLVYSAGLRIAAGDAHLAKDVAQMVFSDLAQKARALPANVVLPGWLYRHACFTASKMVRTERRRAVREQVAMQMSRLGEATADWDLIAPLLDESMSKLSDADQEAIVLRFFNNHDFQTVGQELGISDDAAQKRVTRALEKLRESFSQRGITTSTTALSAVICANAIQAAPAGLSLAVTSAAALASTPLISAAIATTKGIAMTTLQKTILAFVIVAAIGTTSYQAHRASVTADKNLALSEQSRERIDQLTNERDRATNRLASMSEQRENSKGVSPEILQLRGEVARLRAEYQELAKLKTAGSNSPTDSIVASAIDRLRLLTDRLDKTPEARIPELQYLRVEDWLTEANGKLETDQDFRRAFAHLRDTGVANFLRLTEPALHKYLAQNDQQFPTNVAQLRSYFEKPVGDEVFQRYKIVPGSSIPSANLRPEASDWLITPKSYLDPEHEGSWALGRTTLTTYDDSPNMAILNSAMKAMMDDTPALPDGRKKADMRGLGAYLKTPEEKAAYEALMHPRTTSP